MIGVSGQSMMISRKACPSAYSSPMTDTTKSAQIPFEQLAAFGRWQPLAGESSYSISRNRVIRAKSVNFRFYRSRS